MEVSTYNATNVSGIPHITRKCNTNVDALAKPRVSEIQSGQDDVQ